MLQGPVREWQLIHTRQGVDFWLWTPFPAESSWAGTGSRTPRRLRSECCSALVTQGLLLNSALTSKHLPPSCSAASTQGAQSLPHQTTTPTSHPMETPWSLQSLRAAPTSFQKESIQGPGRQRPHNCRRQGRGSAWNHRIEARHPGKSRSLFTEFETI